MNIISTLFVRTLLSYSIVIFALRVLGKRQVGELQPSELVVAIMISDIASIPLGDPSLPISSGIVPILTLMFAEISLALVCLKVPKIRKILTGSPAIIIKKGVICREEMKKNRASAEKYTQLLMIPMSVDVSDVELATILDYEEELTSTGYLFERDGEERRFLLSGIPGGLERDQAELLFMTMVTRLADGEGTAGLTREIAFEKALYTASCKAAMKGGRVDSESDVRFVVEKILSIPDITVCPHGRPVVINLTKSELDRQFGRE